MRALRHRVILNWPRHREKVMYLVVGGWNSLVAYLCFATLYYLLYESLASPVILTLSYAIASVNGYLTVRYLVFRPVRRPIVEYARYQAVYLPILAVNVVVLPLALTYTNLSAYIVQALFNIFAVVVAYLGNKYFAFREPTMRH